MTGRAATRAPGQRARDRPLAELNRRRRSPSRDGRAALPTPARRRRAPAFPDSPGSPGRCGGIPVRGASSPVDRHPCSRRSSSSQALFSVALCVPTSCADLWRRVHPCFRHRDVGRLNAAPNSHQDQGFLTPRHAPRGALAQDPLWSRDPRHRHWPRGQGPQGRR